MSPKQEANLHQALCHRSQVSCHLVSKVTFRGGSRLISRAEWGIGSEAIRAGQAEYGAEMAAMAKVTHFSFSDQTNVVVSFGDINQFLGHDVRCHLLYNNSRSVKVMPCEVDFKIWLLWSWFDVRRGHKDLSLINVVRAVVGRRAWRGDLHKNSPSLLLLLLLRSKTHSA